MLLLAVGAALMVGTPQPAHAGKSEPSPFAGDYCGGDILHVRINSSGRITGSFLGKKISGKISDAGEMVLKWPVAMWDSSGPGRKKTYYRTITGLAALDEDGNLYGILDGYEFFWPRCE
jgi:hypothetical protein